MSSSPITFTFEDVKELHYITPIENVSSILKCGIWSHNKVSHLRKKDISNQEVQNRRSTKDVPRTVNGRRALKIHDHAVLYFNAHNAMLYNIIMTQKVNREDLSVLRINKEVLKNRHAVVSDQNASTDSANFQKGDDFSLSPIRREAILSDSCLAQNHMPIEFRELYRQYRQAEVLIPYRIKPEYIQGAYVYSEIAKQKLPSLKADSIIVFPDLFYRIFNGCQPTIFSRHLKITPPLPSLQIEPESPISNPATPKEEEEEKELQIRNSEEEKQFEPIVFSSSPNPIRQSTMIEIQDGDLLKSKMQTLVNTVNCVGAMGKGIALSFKKNYPNLFLDYYHKCKRKEVKVGEPYIFNISAERKIVNFPTKNDWKFRSEIQWIEQGLIFLAKNINNWSISSLAIPALGCGNGGLLWEDVRPLIYRHLEPLGLEIEIYVSSQPAEGKENPAALSPSKKIKLTSS